MSVNLANYFQLGLSSENNPLNQSLQNTIITPLDTKSSHLNRVSFKCPKVGMLTGDSMIQVQFTNSAGVVANNSQATPNFVNGALGSIARCRLLIGDKVLTDLELPSLHTNNTLYSSYTENQLIDYHYYLMANQFKTEVNKGQAQPNNLGCEAFTRGGRMRENVAGNQFIVEANQIGISTDSNVYGIPLRLLGAQFLDQSALPVFLLGQRELIIEITFHKDCREYVIDSSGAIAGASDFGVNLDRVQLVSTHIQLSDEIEQNERMAMAKKPIQFPLLDQYVVRASTTSGAQETKVNDTFRVNLQNRELHSMVIVNKPINPDGSNRNTANQVSVSLGDVELQIRSNGLNIFDRPITNDAFLYQLSTYANGNKTLKIPAGAWAQTRQNAYQTYQIPTAHTLTVDYLGRFNYQGVDFSNGNPQIFGSGVVQRQSLEIERSYTPSNQGGAGLNANQQFEVLFYVAVSKLLTIGANNISVSF